jgi:hypothetical protein
MNTDISAAMLAEGRLARRALLRQVVVQALAIFIFWVAVNALVRTAVEIYEDFDLALPVNTINFVMRPGAIGVAAATFAPTLLMCGMPWLPYPKAAAWLASLLFLAIAFWLSLVALFAVTPLVDLKLAMGLR